MTGVVLVARARGEKSFGLSSLGCAIALLVLIDPFQSVDPGFALSVLATAGILLFSPIIKLKLLKYIKVDWLVEALAIPISATVFCMPVIVLLSGQFAPVTIPANILVAPMIAPITVLGFIAALLSPFMGKIAELILLPATLLANWIIWVCHRMNDLPVITFNQNGFFIAIFAIFIIAFWYRKIWIVITVFTLVVSQLFFSAVMWPGLGWQVANCDVGQGDGLVINLGGGSGILVDTGPDPAKIDRCLHKLKIHKIPLLVLTHFHADHIGGISSVIENREIGQVWISNLPKPEQTYKQVISELSRFKVRTVEQGDNFVFKSNQVEIRVLWPREQVQEFESLPGDGSAINNSSISLIIKSGSLSLFTAGDIEPEVQELITNSGFLTEVDILKINHHGSRYQYLPMLDLLKPKVAIISVGEGNSYGHPDPSFIGELRRRNIQVWRTDQSGGVSVASPNKIRVTGKEWWRIKWG
jgi:competence protein ComEC